MKKIVWMLVTIALAATGCERDDLPFSPDFPEGFPGDGQGATNLKDPALAWSADSFEATLGAENSFPTLTNTFSVGVTYESSQTEVATIGPNGAITLLGSGSTLISAKSAANETYSASTASYMLTVVSASGSGSDGEAAGRTAIRSPSPPPATLPPTTTFPPRPSREGLRSPTPERVMRPSTATAMVM